MCVSCLRTFGSSSRAEVRELDWLVSPSRNDNHYEDGNKQSGYTPLD